jgi:alkylated DNA nucleotide flippase Atl1
MSRLIPKGNWATYGDVAIAVYGSRNMAVTIGRVARHSPAFVNPHRVLKAGGVIADEGEDNEGNGPRRLARRQGRDRELAVGGDDIRVCIASFLCRWASRVTSRDLTASRREPSTSAGATRAPYTRARTPSIHICHCRDGDRRSSTKRYGRRAPTTDRRKGPRRAVAAGFMTSLGDCS